MNKKSIWGKALLILVILVVAVGLSLALLWSGPETKPKEKTSSAKIVQTVEVNPLTRSVAVSVFGSVIPARRVVIRPQVSGQVVMQSSAMTIGGLVKKDEELIRIDAQDYELALAEVKSNLEQARFEKEVESGRQVIALREWEQLRSELDMEDVNRSLVLREPHLRRAEALMEKAENDIAVAELQISRTRIEAPFNGMVVEESVETGQLLNPTSQICTLVGTDEFWIQVTVPFSELKWIQFPQGDQPGATARVILDTGDGATTAWDGKVIRLLSDLDPLGRMARLIVAVSDPLGLSGQTRSGLPLLLGSYVEVEIDAGQLDDSITIPRAALREGNQIWVATNEGRLKVLSSTLLWSEKDTFIIENVFEPGDELIVSDLRVAIPGMEVVRQRSTAYPEFNQADATKGDNET